MNSKITVAIIAALLSGATLAADALPSARSSELNWLPASPAQLQVLGLGNLKCAEHARFTPVPASWVEGLPVSRHQREVLGSQHQLAVATPASGISPC
jgi:hypothetical protein